MRPTQDRVRQSLFSMVAPRLGGARFLDLYAGSGAVGIEAWSRGAAHVCWVEAHPATVRCLEENVRALCPEAGRIVRGDVERVLKRGLGDAPYDLVFADPPYARGEAITEGATRWGRLLTLLADDAWVAAGAWVAMEQRDGEPLVDHPGWVLVRDRRYGGTRLRILERSGAAAEEQQHAQDSDVCGDV